MATGYKNIGNMKSFAFHNKNNNVSYHIDINQLKSFIDDKFPLEELSRLGCGSHSSWERIEKIPI